MSFDPTGKVILAPMVRVSTHPMRLLALNYGAGYVFCEGTATAEMALKAAKMVEKDVFGIDINMGCPKDYSIKGGMGSALLTKPETVRKILTTLVNGLQIPVTCKIRILPKLEDTLALAKLIESTGVAALTVHGRKPSERPKHRNHDEVIRAVAEAVSIPVIANGGSRDMIRVYEDIEFFRQQTAASGVMLARVAMWNPAIFIDPSLGRETPRLHDVIREYLTLAVRYDHHSMGAKYCIQQMLHLEGNTQLYLDSVGSKNIEELCAIWNMSDMYARESARYTTTDDKSGDLKRSANESPKHSLDPKQNRVDTEVDGDKGEIIRRCIAYERRDWPIGPSVSPKQLLHQYCDKNKMDPPIFRIVEHRDARLFYCSVTLGNQTYENTFGCKSKRFAEQAASLVGLDILNIPNGKLTDRFP